MKVKELINFLNSIENKEQDVVMASYDFETTYPVTHAVEIKSTSDRLTYPIGVNLIGDL